MKKHALLLIGAAGSILSCCSAAWIACARNAHDTVSRIESLGGKALYFKRAVAPSSRLTKVDKWLADKCHIDAVDFVYAIRLNGWNLREIASIDPKCLKWTRVLEMNGTQCDQCLPWIVQFKRLQHLEMVGTGIDDEDVNTLVRSLPALRHLDVRRTRVTSERMQKLRVAYPAVAVFCDD